MKYFFGLILFFATVFSVNAENFQVKLETETLKIYTNDTLQIKLTTNSEILKIEKDFLNITGGRIVNLEKKEANIFTIFIKASSSADKIKMHVVPEKIETLDKEKNSEKSNELDISVTTPPYFASVFGTLRNNNSQPKNNSNINNSSNSSELTNSLFGSLGSIMKLITGSGFGKENFSNNLQNSFEPTKQSGFPGNSGPGDSVKINEAEKDKKVSPEKTQKYNPETPLQSWNSNTQDNPKVGKTQTEEKTTNSTSTKLVELTKNINDGKIVFVDCGAVKDAPGIMVGRFIGAKSFSKHEKLSGGASHSYLLNGTNYCFPTNNSYALGFIPTSQKSSQNGTYKFILFARNINIPNSITGKCAIISPNQITKPTNAVGYLSGSCKGFLKKDYTINLDAVGPVYVLKDDIELTN